MLLVLSTLVLACQVCLLKHRINALSSDVDLNSHVGCERGTNVKEGSQSEIELREVSTLLDAHLQEDKDGTEEAETEMVEDASPAHAEHSSHPAPQEEPSEGGGKDEKDVA